jgi:hypothetical protein
LDQDLFTALLKDNYTIYNRLSDIPTIEELDKAATDLTKAISQAYNRAAKQTLGLYTGYL